MALRKRNPADGRGGVRIIVGRRRRRTGGVIRFRVRAYDPPHMLEYDWVEVPSPSGTITDSTVRFELTPLGDRVRLTLTHRALPAHAFESVAAGWHAHLDVLRAVLTGVDGPDAETRYEALLDRYAKLAP